MAHIATRAGLAAVSVAVAMAVAFYESPEFRRQADAVRRRVARALHQLGDNINPQPQQPLFNRPEDAYAFWAASGQPVPDAPPEVDADEESRRRQRDEIMYWNAVREQRERKSQEAAAAAPASAANGPPPARGTSFDDFLRQDNSATETGAFVFNSGANVWGPTDGLVQRRGDGVRPVAPPMESTNPFADHNRIDRSMTPPTLSSTTMRGDDIDIYSTTTHDIEAHLREQEELLGLAATAHRADSNDRPPLPQRPVAEHEPAAAGDAGQHSAFANIRAWARDSQTAFYSPLPMTPATPVSEPSVISSFDGHEDGQLTPTCSVSLAGSGEDVANDPEVNAQQNGRPLDVFSESEGIPTPASWSEVGSVVSEEEN